MKKLGLILMVVGMLLMFISAFGYGIEKENRWYEENGYTQVYGSGE